MSEQKRGELVPLSTVKSAWNDMHGLDLPHHNDALSPQQAEAISAAYSIELAFAWHGTVEGEELAMPLDCDYEVAAALINSLKPSDVLFVEEAGFLHAERLGDVSFDAESIDDSQRLLMLDRLSKLRQEKAIDVFDYAALLARVKNIPVVHADLDGFELEHVGKAYGGGRTSSLREINQDFTLEHQAQILVIHREEAARNIVKDYALSHLDEVSGRADKSSKPRLVLLFGALHYKTLTRAFQEYGINAKASYLDTELNDRITAASARAVAAHVTVERIDPLDAE